MDHHELGNNLHIPVDTQSKLNVRRFCDVLLKCLIATCPLGCRNIRKLLNGENVHFRFKTIHTHTHEEKNNEQKDLFLSILNINKIDTHKT